MQGDRHVREMPFGKKLLTQSEPAAMSWGGVTPDGTAPEASGSHRKMPMGDSCWATQFFWLWFGGQRPKLQKDLEPNFHKLGGYFSGREGCSISS